MGLKMPRGGVNLPFWAQAISLVGLKDGIMVEAGPCIYLRHLVGLGPTVCCVGLCHLLLPFEMSNSNSIVNLFEIIIQL